MNVNFGSRQASVQIPALPLTWGGIIDKGLTLLWPGRAFEGLFLLCCTLTLFPPNPNSSPSGSESHTSGTAGS